MVALLMPNIARADELTDAINAERSRYGLHSLAYDSSLASWAAENNRHQRSRGLGHFVFIGGRQNAAWNCLTVPSVVSAWMHSPGHRAAILAVDVTVCGGSFDGIYYTWNAAQAVATPQRQVESKPATTSPLATEQAPSTGLGGSGEIQACPPRARHPRRCGFRLFWGCK